jgi:hypothetical protein
LVLAELPRRTVGWCTHGQASQTYLLPCPVTVFLLEARIPCSRRAYVAQKAYLAGQRELVVKLSM